MMIAYLSTPLVSVVDMAIIGQLGDPALMGGVAVASVIFDVVFSAFNFLRAATTGLTAQALGAGEGRELRAVMMRSGAIAIAAGTLVVALQWAIAFVGFRGMGVSGAVAEAGLVYFHVRVWSAPFILLNYAILGWVLGRGEGGAGLFLQAVLNGVNVVLCLWFVLRLGWGVEGAAFAAVIAEGVTALVGLVLVRARIASLFPTWSDVWKPAEIRRMFAINWDIMIRSLALVLGLAVFTRESAAFGPVILAANSVLLRFYMVTSCFLDGIATAAEQLAGRAVGARFRPAFDRVVRLTLGWGLGTSLMLSGIFILAGPTLIESMTTAADVREAANRYLAWAALMPLAGVVAFQMDGIFIGATWSRDMRNLMIISLAIYLGCLAAFTRFWGDHGLWAAMLIFLGARSVAFPLRLRTLSAHTFTSPEVVRSS
jgi:MATE family multidrug resistance protein